MNRYRHHLTTQTLALLPVRRMICSAAYVAHRQQGPCPPLWRPVKLYQYLRRQQALKWLLDAVVRSLQGHMLVGSYLQSRSIEPANLLHVRTNYLQNLLNHTKEDSPKLAFEDYLPTHSL